MIEGGDLDINFIVTGPQDTAVVMQPHSKEGLHGIDIKITGEYEICLDNTFSRMTGNWGHLIWVWRVARVGEGSYNTRCVVRYVCC